MIDVAQIAQTWGASKRTVQRWRGEGAPLDDSARLRSWLAGRKNLPRQTRAILDEQSKARRVQVVTSIAPALETEAPKVGAAAALRRLEESEVVAYTLLQAAIHDGDQHQIKLARENWIKIGDSLRRYDLLVEASRRDSGQLVPREEAEAAITNFVYWLKILIRRTTNGIAPQLLALDHPADMQLAIESAFFDDVLSGVAIMAAMPCKKKVPDWLLAAMKAPMSDTLKGIDEAVKGRIKALEEAFVAEESARAMDESIERTGSP